MKASIRLSVLSLALTLALTACQKPAEPKAEQPAQTTDTKAEQPAEPAKTEQTAESAQVDLSAETAEYKQWVEGQIDNLLADTEKFVGFLKEGKLDEAKAIYPLARMYFERSEPIVESFGDLAHALITVKPTLSKAKNGRAFTPLKKSYGHKTPPKVPKSLPTSSSLTSKS